MMKSSSSKHKDQLCKQADDIVDPKRQGDAKGNHETRSDKRCDNRANARERRQAYDASHKQTQRCERVARKASEIGCEIIGPDVYVARRYRREYRDKTQHNNCKNLDGLCHETWSLLAPANIQTYFTAGNAITRIDDGVGV